MLLDEKHTLKPIHQLVTKEIILLHVLFTAIPNHKKSLKPEDKTCVTMLPRYFIESCNPFVVFVNSHLFIKTMAFLTTLSTPRCCTFTTCALAFVRSASPPKYYPHLRLQWQLESLI